MNKDHLYPIQLQHKGEMFEIEVDEETYMNLTEDEQALALYAEQVYNAIHSTDNSSGASFKWSHNLTLLLIDQRLSKEKEFNRPVCKKKKIWASIAEDISKISGTLVTADMCDTKYRNLLATYRTNKTKSQQSGESSITWEYYELFDRVIGTKASSLPSTNVLGDVDSMSVGSEDQNMSGHTSEAETQSAEPVAEEDNKEKKTKKLKSSFDFGEYLREKHKFDKERHLHKEEQAEKKWKEKKDIKEREIEAIEKLANAIAGKYQP